MLTQSLLTTDRRKALAAVDKSVLVVISAVDNPLVEQEQRMAATLPHSKLVMVDHAAHAVFFDQPDQFNEQLRAFVAGLESRAGSH
jgi:pimeloyl-ACP methyl ester carboxylesterase